MADLDELRDALKVARWVLLGVKTSVEAPFAAQYRQKTPYAEIYKRLILEIEAMRISVLAAGRTHPSPEEPIKLAHEIHALRNNHEYADIMRAVRFRMSPSDPTTKMFAEQIQSFREANVSEALSMLQDMLLSGEDPAAIPADRPTLRSIVPDQKIAPLQFTVIDDKINVVRRASPSRPTDASSIASAREELQRSGEKIISELQVSNCDKRLLASVQELQAQFGSEIDAVKLGLMNIGCESMCHAFGEELPTALASMLRAHTRGVQMFVGQFPEWTTFVENAAAAELGKEDIDQLKSASQVLVGEMTARPDIVDPEVPRTLSILTEMLGSPSQAGKRAAFAVLRSFENLVSKVFGYGASFLEKTAEKTVEAASGVTSRIIIGMLLLGISGATAIGPISGKIPDMNWMKTAAEIVSKQLKELKLN